MIKAINTEYNGYLFRSRLEARWAVFFDAVGIKYVYEPEGFTNSKGYKYLPDFYLPEFNTYVEVKAEKNGAWDELKKASCAIEWGSPVRRLLVLSDIPYSFDGGLWHFPIFYWDGIDDKVSLGWWFFSDISDDKAKGNISRAKYRAPWTINDDGEFVSYNRELSFQAISDSKLNQEINHRGLEQDVLSDWLYLHNKLTLDGYKKARQARFEHGETPTNTKRREAVNMAIRKYFNINEEDN